MLSLSTSSTTTTNTRQSLLHLLHLLSSAEKIEETVRFTMMMTKQKATPEHHAEKKKVHGGAAKTPKTVTPNRNEARISSIRTEIRKLKKKIVVQKEEVKVMKKDTGKLLVQKKKIAIALEKADRMMKVAHAGYEKAALEHNAAQATRRRCHEATEWNPSSEDCWAMGVDANKKAMKAVQKLDEIMNLVSAVQDEKTSIQQAYDQTTSTWYNKLKEYMSTGARLENMLAKRFELRMTLYQLEHPGDFSVDKENNHRHAHHDGGGGDLSTGTWHV